jgi:DNA-binding NtrC family response regulator
MCVPFSGGQDKTRHLDEAERSYIIAAMAKTKGGKKLAAERLNIGLRSLYRKLKEYKRG